jgi:hypothetical protein
MGHFRLAGQEERACDLGSTVETSVPMPEPGELRAVGAPAWLTRRPQATEVRLSGSFGWHIVRQAPMDMERRASVGHAEMSHQITELVGGARRVHIRHIETGCSCSRR